MRTDINPSGKPGLFNPAIVEGDTVYVSGQGGLRDGALVPGGIEAEAMQALKNIAALLDAADASADDLVSITCYLADIREWDRMNESWTKFFSGRRVPTRTAIGVAGLPFGMRVEMTAVARTGRREPR